MRLDKYLSDLNIGTRKEIKNAVRKGRVLVNGETACDPGMTVTGAEKVTFDGRELSYEEHVYYMLNKPKGVITASRDPRQETVLDLLGDARRKDLFAVGRLDKDTTGLLLLTNDGAFDHHLMSPKHHVEKEYYALVRGEVTGADAALFAAGVKVDEELTAAPAHLEILSSGACSEVLLTIHEGKFHQVKRMFTAVGKEVTELRRIRIGALRLDPALPEGGFRALTDAELDSLQ